MLKWLGGNEQQVRWAMGEEELSGCGGCLFCFKSCLFLLFCLYFLPFVLPILLVQRKKRLNFVRKQMRAYANGHPVVTQQVHDYAMQHFRKLIEEHRAATLGSESEWALARDPLAVALRNANKSVAYWRKRLKSDPDNEVAAHQYKTVKALKGKLGSALSRVDERADLLLKFYDECEAKLAIMDRCNQDIRETRKVEALSQQAGTVIAQAQGAIQALGHSFVEEAQKIARALGDTAGTQYKILAGDASLDNIDYVADKIVECSDSEQKQIQDMKKALTGGGAPVQDGQVLEGKLGSALSKGGRARRIAVDVLQGMRSRADVHGTAVTKAFRFRKPEK